MVNKYIKKIEFEKLCLLIIFIGMELLYIVGFIDLSDKVITLLGLAVLLLTLVDIVWEDNSKVVKVIYCIGLGIIMISPIIKPEILDKVSVDSTSITLISLIFVIASMIMNQVKRKNEQDKIRQNEIRNSVINSSRDIMDGSAKIIEGLSELSRNLLNLNHLYSETLCSQIGKDMNKKSVKYKGFLEKINKIEKQVNEIEKQYALLEKDQVILKKRINTSIQENTKYIIEENYKEQLSNQ